MTKAKSHVMLEKVFDNEKQVFGMFHKTPSA